MSGQSREELMRAWTDSAGRRLSGAGDSLAERQALSGPGHGNVAPWSGSDELDFHGTLAAIWVWSRAQKVGGEDRFALNVAAAWSFVESACRRFIPTGLGPSASDEAAYDCAMLLRAASADHSRAAEPLHGQVQAAARLLTVYLSDLDDLNGREFRDPGFLAWSLAEFAREQSDRSLLASARRFVDRAFGMKAPPAFAAEPSMNDGLFDFSSTSATRILSVIAAEGSTPFVGAWLRERVGPHAPPGIIARATDESAWNACVAIALGRSYVVATDPVFFDSHQAILAGLEARSNGGGVGRTAGSPPETLPTFHYALAVDALVKP